MAVAAFVSETLALASNQDVRQVSLETSLLDLNLDSLALVSLLAKAEAVYGIEILPEDTQRMIGAASVSDLVTRIERLVAGRGESS